MAEFEVPEPIICSPYVEPAWHWFLTQGEDPKKRPGPTACALFLPGTG